MRENVLKLGLYFRKCRLRDARDIERTWPITGDFVRENELLPSSHLEIIGRELNEPWIPASVSDSVSHQIGSNSWLPFVTDESPAKCTICRSALVP